MHKISGLTTWYWITKYETHLWERIILRNEREGLEGENVGGVGGREGKGGNDVIIY
jgi:hypothetical protein